MTKQILEVLEEVAAEQKDPERAGLLLAAYNRVLRLQEMDVAALADSLTPTT